MFLVIAYSWVSVLCPVGMIICATIFFLSYSKKCRLLPVSLALICETVSQPIPVPLLHSPQRSKIQDRQLSLESAAVSLPQHTYYHIHNLIYFFILVHTNVHLRPWYLCVQAPWRKKQDQAWWEYAASDTDPGDGARMQVCMARHGCGWSRRQALLV